MTQLPKLFALGKKDQILEWEIVVEDNSYYTITGASDAKKVISKKTYCEGKNIGRSNETSPEKQAFAEAKSKWEKKQKSGGYWENINDINKTKYIEPQLAEKYKDFKNHVNFKGGRWGSQNKFNGICCIASKDGCYSRKGEKFMTVPHIESSLKSFFDKYPNAVLHGELFNDTYRQQLNEIVKLCRKTVNITNEDLVNSEKLIKFYIYDGYFPDSNLPESSTYENRKQWIDDNVVVKYKYCIKVETKIVHSYEEMMIEFQKRIVRGDEGLILRNMDMPYEHNRTKNLLKVKPNDSAEFIITDIKEGVGNWSGVAKIISLKDKNNKTFDATFKGTLEEANECLKNKNKWIGKTVTINYIGFTGLGTPQYAQFDYKNCLRVD